MWSPSRRSPVTEEGPLPSGEGPAALVPTISLLGITHCGGECAAHGGLGQHWRSEGHTEQKTRSWRESGSLSTEPKAGVLPNTPNLGVLGLLSHRLCRGTGPYQEKAVHWTRRAGGRHMPSHELQSPQSPGGRRPWSRPPAAAQAPPGGRAGVVLATPLDPRCRHRPTAPIRAHEAPSGQWRQVAGRCRASLGTSSHSSPSSSHRGHCRHILLLKVWGSCTDGRFKKQAYSRKLFNTN